jgi:glutathione S-transferase
VALEECGKPYETIAIDLQNKPKEFCDLYARANPIPDARAKVPVLEVAVDDDQSSFVITESLVVAEYLAERYPDAGLMPGSCEDRATMRLFSELCGASSISYWNILRAQTGGDDEKREAAVEQFKQALINIDAFLEKKGDPEGPFLFGDRFSLAECNIAPFLQRACNALPAFAAIHPIDLCKEQGLARLETWILATLARPSVQHIALPEDEMKASVSKMLKRFAEMEKKM